MPGRGSREFVLRILSSAPDVKVRGWHFIPHDETSLSATICHLLMEKFYGVSGKKLFNFSDGKDSPAYAYWESGPGLRQGRLPAVEVMPPARDRTESLCRYRPSELRFPRNRDAGSGLLVSPPTSRYRMAIASFIMHYRLRCGSRSTPPICTVSRPVASCHPISNRRVAGRTPGIQTLAGTSRQCFKRGVQHRPVATAF